MASSAKTTSSLGTVHRPGKLDNIRLALVLAHEGLLGLKSTVCRVAQTSRDAQRAVVAQVAADFPNDHRHERSKGKNSYPGADLRAFRALDGVKYFDAVISEHDSVHAGADKRLLLSRVQTVPLRADRAQCAERVLFLCVLSGTLLRREKRLRGAVSVVLRARDGVTEAVSSSSSAYSSYSRPQPSLRTGERLPAALLVLGRGGRRIWLRGQAGQGLRSRCARSPAP